MNNNPPIILASASPQRKELLESTGLEFSIKPMDIDESAEPKELPKVYAQRIANEKAQAAHKQHPDAVVIAADSIVAVGRKILQKADTREQAEEMLRLQSGRRINVITAVAVAAPDGKIYETLNTSWIKVKPLTNAEISAFLADESEWRGVCGAVRILGGKCSSFYQKIQGSPSGIIGLPLYETQNLLKRAGIKV